MDSWNRGRARRRKSGLMLIRRESSPELGLPGSENGSHVPVEIAGNALSRTVRGEQKVAANAAEGRLGNRWDRVGGASGSRNSK
jgi:hypothetical protein